MARNKGEMPPVSFIGPGRTKVKHVYVLFQILERDEQGIATKCRLCRDDEVFDVTDPKNRDFMTGYIPAQCMEPYTKGKDNG